MSREIAILDKITFTWNNNGENVQTYLDVSNLSWDDETIMFSLCTYNSVVPMYHHGTLAVYLILNDVNDDRVSRLIAKSYRAYLSDVVINTMDDSEYLESWYKFKLEV